jgi:hypothetical protein
LATRLLRGRWVVAEIREGRKHAHDTGSLDSVNVSAAGRTDSILGWHYLVYRDRSATFAGV